MSEGAVPTDLQFLKGVGPKRVKVFEQVGIRTIRDLLYLFPRRYEDRSQFTPIADVQPASVVTLRGEVLSCTLKRLRSMTLLEASVGDETGVVRAVWFNQPYLKNQLVPGTQIILYGKADLHQGHLKLASPEYEIAEADADPVHALRITPVYPLTEGLFQRSLRKTLYDAVKTHLDRSVEEYLPEPVRRRYRLMELREAVRQMHIPVSFESQLEARKRVVFDEFLLFEVLLFQRIEAMRTASRSYPVAAAPAEAEIFEKALPFTLTESQRAAVATILRDMARAWPMNRLLQGDVGSGKTVVAAAAMAAVAQSGHQAAMLVPTEILAEQHYKTLTRLLEPCGIRPALLTSSTGADKRARILAELKQGKLRVLAGTHSILREDVRFLKLALVVIDEQHKFGVHQRHQLLERSPRPHQLVMTATPIPRTLALTVFGDLDVSLMKDLPAGRKPIATFWITRLKQPEVLAHILERIRAGDQAYFIYPSIEETESSDLAAARQGYEALKKGALAGVKIGLVHGRLARDDREAVMKSFAARSIQALVATSVVEVGVDHPNATVMVIENAERFGLSQLHQLRGRIGRGEKASECFLFGEPKTEEGARRLRVMTKTQNGFVIAEEDLKLRGPGEFLGTRQSGAPLFRYGDPSADEALFMSAREAAGEIVRGGLLTLDPAWAAFLKVLEATRLQY